MSRAVLSDPFSSAYSHKGTCDQLEIKDRTLVLCFCIMNMIPHNTVILVKRQPSLRRLTTQRCHCHAPSNQIPK